MDKSRLVGPLGRSLKNRIRARDEDRAFDDLADDIDSYIDAAPSPIKTAEVEAAFRIAFRALVVRYARELYFHMNFAMRKCDESPIEGMMLAALVLLCAEKQHSLQIHSKGLNSLTTEGLPRLIITPQAVIGDYRVDFLLEYEDTVPDFENQITVKEGLEVPGTLDVKSRVIVECDGHDFHEKTKEQARKDKQRDRLLQSLGFPVFRFVGSEIWSDPLKCADEVFSQLEKVSVL